MNTRSPRWLLLITNLPGQNQTLRMRIWRGLKAAGAALMRDGVYLLPETPDFQRVFEEHAREIRAVAGSVHILHFGADSTEQQNALIGLFDRTADYQEFIARLQAWRNTLSMLAELEARKTLSIIAREA